MQGRRGDVWHRESQLGVHWIPISSTALDTVKYQFYPKNSLSFLWALGSSRNLVLGSAIHNTITWCLPPSGPFHEPRLWKVQVLAPQRHWGWDEPGLGPSLWGPHRRHGLCLYGVLTFAYRLNFLVISTWLSDLGVDNVKLLCEHVQVSHM